MSNTRPKWKNTRISEADFGRVYKYGMIDTIKAKWDYTSEDTTKEWLEVCGKDKTPIKLPHSWSEAFAFYGSATVPGLFKLTYAGEECLKNLNEIDAWEKKNKQERSEYERLKAKFEAEGHK